MNKTMFAKGGKKAFLIIPAIILLAAGCNTQNQPTVQTQTESPAPQQIAPSNGAQARDNANGPDYSPNAGKVQTYNNTRYAYSVQYPSNWFVDSTSSEKDFTLRGGTDYIGGDTVFSNYANPDQYSGLDNPAPADFYTVNLMVYKSTDTIDAFIKKTGFIYSKKETVSVNGLSAVKLTSTSKDQPTGITVVNTLIKVQNKIFVFNYSGKAIPANVQSTYESIVNSFSL
jgi:hypothetical protein